MGKKKQMPFPGCANCPQRWLVFFPPKVCLRQTKQIMSFFVALDQIWRVRQRIGVEEWFALHEIKLLLEATSILLGPALFVNCFFCLKTRLSGSQGFDVFPGFLRHATAGDHGP